ncbi:DUF397 domain-containing protein [Streptomyces sp. NPDC003077]|uniref:DUF397 domain-containing protein n=1 Tax=Streptomyces sp. NPDC003077 TaxID=3154443 RepID=UPI0033AA4D8A
MSTSLDPSRTVWVKSSYSNGGGGNCVEWSPATAAAGDLVPVRDSKRPDGPVLAFPSTVFAEFVNAVKEGRI